MEVMVGSSFGIGMAAYGRDRSGVSVLDKDVPSALFFSDKSEGGGSQIGIGLRNSCSKSPEESSDSSSSIGENSENEEEKDDVVLCQGGTLDSFSSSLKDSLPIKRGLSNHYMGKSKSFVNLIEAKSLEKVENPFNKKRRLIIANKLRRKGRYLSDSQFYTWQNPNSISLLAIQEPNDDDDELLEKRKIMMMLMKNKRDLMAQIQSCLCLSSLPDDE